eukprot:1442461-Rhodomonas_salina.1
MMSRVHQPRRWTRGSEHWGSKQCRVKLESSNSVERNPGQALLVTSGRELPVTASEAQLSGGFMAAPVSRLLGWHPGSESQVDGQTDSDSQVPAPGHGGPAARAEETLED